jgi:hypothetical protein
METYWCRERNAIVECKCISKGMGIMYKSAKWKVSIIFSLPYRVLTINHSFGNENSHRISIVKYNVRTLGRN